MIFVRDKTSTTPRIQLRGHITGIYSLWISTVDRRAKQEAMPLCIMAQPYQKFSIWEGRCVDYENPYGVRSTYTTTPYGVGGSEYYERPSSC